MVQALVVARAKPKTIAPPRRRAHGTHGKDMGMGRTWASAKIRNEDAKKSMVTMSVLVPVAHGMTRNVAENHAQAEIAKHVPIRDAGCMTVAHGRKDMTLKKDIARQNARLTIAGHVTVLLPATSRKTVSQRDVN